MEIATVVGHVWATKKEETLTGFKLMVVQPITGGAAYVAADVVSAGIGERVLVVNGSTARRALGSDDCAIDCAIVGIIDALEVDRELTQKLKSRAAGKRAGQGAEQPGKAPGNNGEPEKKEPFEAAEKN